MRLLAILITTAMTAGAATAATLEELAGALRKAPSWQASFTQRYVPAGFEQGTTEKGSILLAPPLRLRFEYADGERVFAVDGSVARLVDRSAGTCDALRLEGSAWGRLPLATLLDPEATRRSFEVEERDDGLRLVPREPVPDLAELLVTPGADGLPARIVVLDAGGNRNEIAMSEWRAGKAADEKRFRPALPGMEPCRPED